MATALDEAWSKRRANEDIHHAWRWADIVPDAREAFVVRAKEEPIAIWSSKLGSPIELGGQKYYRLDYVASALERLQTTLQLLVEKIAPEIKDRIPVAIRIVDGDDQPDIASTVVIADPIATT